MATISHSPLLPTLLALLLSAGTTGAAADPDEEICRSNLSRIHEAIQAYRKAEKDLPDRLFDLFPRFISNKEILICPAARKKGQTSSDVTLRTQFFDPETTYFYEFTQVELSDWPGYTERDWKRRQMGMLGSVVPIVRCLVHDKPLNLSFGGEIYESGLYWEHNFTNLVEEHQLGPVYLFSRDILFRVVSVPARDPHATPAQIDLTEYFNGSWNQIWKLRRLNSPLATPPLGLRDLAGVPFDLRGGIQLRADNHELALFPASASGIPIDTQLRKIHFLHAAWSSALPGTPIAEYGIHFADGTKAVQPVEYGTHLLDWRLEPWIPGGAQSLQSHLAWPPHGTDTHPTKQVHLYKLTWKNPKPEQTVSHIDFVSKVTRSSPILLAITIEP